MANDFKYTTTTLRKIEEIVEAGGYTLRYERGTFKTGCCLLDDKKVVVVNQFFGLEGRINSLIDLIPELKIEAAALPENLRSLYDRISLQSATG